MTTRTDPAWLACLLQLSIDTHVDTFDFADWMHEHRFELRDQFLQSGGKPSRREVEDTLGIWLRERFREQLRKKVVEVSVIYPEVK